MAIKWGKEAGVAVVCEIGAVLVGHFGYVAIATSAYLFKLAVAATLASYSAFLCATLVGGFITYFPTRAMMWVLESMGADENSQVALSMLTHFTLSPMVGAYALNFALGWSLPLMPMLAVGAVGVVIAFTVLMVANVCKCRDEEETMIQAKQGYNSNAMYGSGSSKLNVGSRHDARTAEMFQLSSRG